MSLEGGAQIWAHTNAGCTDSFLSGGYQGGSACTIPLAQRAALLPTNTSISPALHFAVHPFLLFCRPGSSISDLPSGSAPLQITTTAQMPSILACPHNPMSLFQPQPLAAGHRCLPQHRQGLSISCWNVWVSGSVMACQHQGDLGRGGGKCGPHIPAFSAFSAPFFRIFRAGPLV